MTGALHKPSADPKDPKENIRIFFEIFECTFRLQRINREKQKAKTHMESEIFVVAQ